MSESKHTTAASNPPSNGTAKVNSAVRINRVVYSLFDKSNFVVSRRGLSYLMICEV